jgi:hypothetical protein
VIELVLLVWCGVAPDSHIKDSHLDHVIRALQTQEEKKCFLIQIENLENFLEKNTE